MNDEVKDGNLNYSLGPLFIPSGKYNLEIEISDAKGNKGIFNDVFEITNAIILDVSIDKQVIKVLFCISLINVCFVTSWFKLRGKNEKISETFDCECVSYCCDRC